MGKKLKKFQTYDYGKRVKLYIAAYSQQQAAELGDTRVSDIRTRAATWGNTMDGIEPTEPCVFEQKGENIPYKVFPTPTKEEQQYIYKILAEQKAERDRKWKEEYAEYEKKQNIKLREERYQTYLELKKEFEPLSDNQTN